MGPTPVYGARAEKPCHEANEYITNRQKNKKDKLGPVAPLPKFSGYVEVEATPSTIWVRPLITELGPKKYPEKPILP